MVAWARAEKIDTHAKIAYRESTTLTCCRTCKDSKRYNSPFSIQRYQINSSNALVTSPQAIRCELEGPLPPVVGKPLAVVRKCLSKDSRHTGKNDRKWAFSGVSSEICWGRKRHAVVNVVLDKLVKHSLRCRVIAFRFPN